MTIPEPSKRTANPKHLNSEKRRRSIIEDRRQRISESFQVQPVNLQASSNATLLPLSAEELSSSFDEWMKIKINSTNSWKLDLIDYFYDLTVLKDGDSINFQKASCTLDGCVKIYTSRVDSVDSETKKLLSGLLDHSSKASNNDDEIENIEPATKKREHRIGNTLEKDISKLDLDEFKLEFVVDPLFRKTSADFDEGGARGLLLNHLSISTEGKIIFDAGDAATLDDSCDSLNETSRNDIDLQKLFSRFRNLLNNLDDFEICKPLKDFEFTNNNQYFDPVLDFSNPINDYDYAPPAQDDSSNVEDNDYDFGYHEETNVNNNVNHSESFMNFSNSNAQDSIFSYFDSAMLKNWAGPEHWRSRPLKAREEKTKKRAPKVREHLQFTLDESVDFKALFLKGNAATTISRNEKSKLNNILPDDVHFSSKDFKKLFSNPEKQVAFKSKDPHKSVLTRSPDGPMDVNFWTQNERIYPSDEPTNQVEDNLEFGDIFGDEDSVNEEPLIDSIEHQLELLDFGDQLVEQPKKVMSAPLQYAKTAKRVDVKKLKENIWKEMTVPIPEAGNEKIELQGEKKFSEVFKGLDQFYPEKKRNDISVAFCFICVLHLANEQNLSIKGSKELKELTITQN